MGWFIPIWVAKIVTKRVITYLVAAGIFGAGYGMGKRRKKDDDAK